jgi:ABC-type nitrate/sulfonate/bicarbonate transport system substrate-binding protein
MRYGSHILLGVAVALSIALVPQHLRAQVNKSGAGGLAPPSNGSYLVPIIKALNLDKKNGLDFDINLYSSPGTLYSDYAAGRTTHVFGALYSGANFAVRGVPTKLLFTISTANHAFISNNPKIQQPSDLEGKTVAATTSSGFYGMASLFLKANGLDPRKNINIIDANPAAVRTFLVAGRADAGLQFEPALSSMLLEGYHLVGDMNQGIRNALGMKRDAAVWYLGCFANADWADKNPDKVKATLKMWQEAAAYYNEHPDEADKMIGDFTKVSVEALKKSRELGLGNFVVKPAIDEKANLDALFAGFVDAGFLTNVPDASVYYSWPGGH